MQAWHCPYYSIVLIVVFLVFSLDTVAFKERKKMCTLRSCLKKGSGSNFNQWRAIGELNFRDLEFEMLTGAEQSWDQAGSFFRLEYKLFKLFHQISGKKVQVERLINQLQNIFSNTLILVDTENCHNTLEKAKKKCYP